MVERMLEQKNPEFGLGLILDEENYFFHSGSNAGFRCIFRGHLRDGYGLVIMINSERGMKLVPELVRSIAREYEWDDLKPQAVLQLGAPTSAQLAAFTGRYRLGPGRTMIITATGDHVIVDINGSNEPYWPIGDDVVASWHGFLRL